jgi:glucosamine-6-phosphate deaminase
MIFHKDKLTVKRFAGRREMGQAAAADAAAGIKELLLHRDDINIIFASAPSQDDFLSALSEHDIAWERVNAFHMDEYIGLPAGAPQGFGYYLKQHLFKNIPLKRVFYLGDAASPDSDSQEKEIARYTALLKQYPPDIVFLGIGENGHVAFNDPHVADFADPELVKVVDLDLACRQQQVNDGCFASLPEVPTHAYTLTIPALTAARYMFCIVPSNTKAQAVYNTLYGEISASCPASILRTKENAILYLDSDSSMLLNI